MLSRNFLWAFQVFLHGERTRLEVALAMRFLHQRVLGAVGEFIGASSRKQCNGVIPAGGWPVFIHAAAFGAHELAGGAAFNRLVFDARDIVAAELERVGVFLEEFGRGHAQPLFQANDVVGREHDVDVGTAGIPAVNAFSALKLDDLVALEAGGQHRAGGEGGIGNDFVVAH